MTKRKSKTKTRKPQAPQPARRPPAPRRRSNNNAVSSVGLGSKPVRYHFTELLTPKWDSSKKNEVFSIAFQPGASQLTRLDQFGGLYEQWALRKCAYKFIPTVGTTKDGSYVCAIDMDASDAATDRSGIYSHTPRIANPVWKAGNLAVNPSRAMKSRWHMTAHGTTPTSGYRPSPGYQATHALIISSDEPLIIEVTYEVELLNPTPPWGEMMYTTPNADAKWYGPDGSETGSARVRPGATYRVSYAGTSSWWDTFKEGFDTLRVLSDSTVASVRRISATAVAYDSLVLSALTAGGYLSLTGAPP